MSKYIISDIFKGDYPISQYYGNNVAYYSQFGFNGHEGVDWATPVGVDVLAPFNRNIILQDQDDPKSGAYGDYVVVWDPDQKCAVWYCHLSVNNVELGKEYPKGTVIGQTGNTGNTTGPHLHVNFVETDINGVRQNTSNGFKGMLNILDQNLVEWQLGNQPLPAPTQPNGTIAISITERDMLVNKASKYDEFVNGGYDSLDKIKTDIKSKTDTIDNLNTQISKIQSESGAKDTTISTLQSQVTDLTSERDRLSKQAEEWISKQTSYDQMEKDYRQDKIDWAEAQKKNNYEIGAYKNTSYKTVNIQTLITEVLRRIFHLNG